MKKKYSNLNVLLEETPITFYWLGFLMADGSFKNNRLVLELCDKDHFHLEKFAEFIQFKGCFKNKRLAVMDTQPMIILRERYKIHNNKTCNPCELSSVVDDDLFLSWAVGFIDGDGCICKQTGREDCQIKIKTHISWKDNLQLLSNRLSEMGGTVPVKVGINSYGYATLNFGNSILLKYLKNNIKLLNLPVLDRKWDLIDITTIGIQERSKINNKIITELLSQKVKKVI